MKRIYLFLLSFMMLSGICNWANAQSPSITTPYPSYVQGDSIVFSYVSPTFSATDKIAIYKEGTKPSAENLPIDWKYIPQSTGSITFKTELEVRGYDAYLLCCDGYDSLSSVTFEILDPSVAFIHAKKINFEAGETLEFSYNDPEFVSGDIIAIYPFGEPSTGISITYSYVVSKWGLASFPGVLPAGSYYAVLVNSSNSEYARSDDFSVPERTTGSYVKTASNIYPVGSSILVNYRDEDLKDKDWIGIYKKGVLPDGDPEAVLWEYAVRDSSTIEFNALPFGDYVVYLFCCDGYEVKARYDFKVVGLNTPSIVLNAISFIVGEPLEFTYNDPNVAAGITTEWIGIYNEGDIPGPSVRSIVWDYLTVANGTMSFSVPYPYGTWPEDYPETTLPVGEYYAGLFYNDGYGILAQANFSIVEEGTGILPELSQNSRVALFPNPTNGLVSIRLSNGDQLRKIVVYSLTGQVLYQEVLNGSVNQKALDLKHLGKGVYFVEALTDHYKTSKKLVIH